MTNDAYAHIFNEEEKKINRTNVQKTYARLNSANGTRTSCTAPHTVHRSVAIRTCSCECCVCVDDAATTTLPPRFDDVVVDVVEVVDLATSK